MFTVYLFKVVWGGDARICARVINLFAGLPNKRNSFTKLAERQNDCVYLYYNYKRIMIKVQ